ncbi:MAG TPA: FkbM family methyltransferase [Fimbriiglobus sp.]|jgi:FkbM family methyltransferase|nr:FkbM family methyltransferase [Fimbriiglobus sp.]
MLAFVRRGPAVRRVNLLLLGALATLGVLYGSRYYRIVYFKATGTVRVEGSVYELDPDDRMITTAILQGGCWEPAETALIRDTLKPGDTFIDVGANFGFYTVLAARLVGPTGRVIAFEPDPRSFELLRRNVERNGCTNVVLEQKALSSEPGTLTLQVSDSNRGGHSVVRGGTEDVSHTVDVPAVRLDDYLSGRDVRVDLVKIDTEGAEGFILAGMQDTLRKYPAAKLVLEYTPGKLVNSGYPPDKFMGLLKPHGFRYAEIDEYAHLLHQVVEQDVVDGNLESLKKRGLTNLYLTRDR